MSDNVGKSSNKSHALGRRQRGLKRLQEMIAVAENDVANGRVGKFDRNKMKKETRERLAQRGVYD
jgi:hypothetical protein